MVRRDGEPIPADSYLSLLLIAAATGFKTFPKIPESSETFKQAIESVDPPSIHLQLTE
jgi:hypothetical protein